MFWSCACGPILGCLLVIATAAGTLPAQHAPPPLGKGTTEALVGRYEASEHWVQKVVVLLSLNQFWHPVGNQMILSAIRDSDTRLQSPRSCRACSPAVCAVSNDVASRPLTAGNDDLDAAVRVEMQACDLAHFDAGDPQNAVVLVDDQRQAVAIEAR